jgi:hypothetical protein
MGALKMRVAIVLLAIGLASAGCGDKLAQSVASRTLKSVVAYESAVDAKIAVERAFYMKQREAIQRRLLGYAAVGGAADERIEPEKTVYYGRIRVSAERDARVVADSLVAGGSSQVLGGAIDYLDRGVREEGQLRLTLIQRQQELTVKLLDQLETIDAQKARLALVRDRLKDLSQNPGTLEQLRVYVDVGKGVMSLLRPQPEP